MTVLPLCVDIPSLTVTKYVVVTVGDTEMNWYVDVKPSGSDVQ